MIKIVSYSSSDIPHRYILLQTKSSRLGIIIGFTTCHECMYYTDQRGEPSIFRVHSSGKLSLIEPQCQQK